MRIALLALVLSAAGCCYSPTGMESRAPVVKRTESPFAYLIERCDADDYDCVALCRAALRTEGYDASAVEFDECRMIHLDAERTRVAMRYPSDGCYAGPAWLGPDADGGSPDASWLDAGPDWPDAAWPDAGPALDGGADAAIDFVEAVAPAPDLAPLVLQPRCLLR